MKERPILMTPANAQKCHDGTKTQTRRIIKSQPPQDVGKILGPGMYAPVKVDRFGEEHPGGDVFGVYSGDGEWGAVCPYGVVGDRLWVREAHRIIVLENEQEITSYKGAPVKRMRDILDMSSWLPSIHMRREHCRTVLEITDVRVERLQAISDADALAEGVLVRPDAEIAARVAGPPETGARMEYFALWESIHGVGSWGQNLWVWVLTFRKIEVPQ